MLMWLFWLAVSLIAFVAEILTPGALVSIWFALAALAAAVVSLAVPSFIIQTVVFAAASLACMLMLRPILSCLLSRQMKPEAQQKYVGRNVKVIKDIQPGETGYVRMDGIDWSAVSPAGIPLKAGTRVIVESISGNKLVVRKEITENGYHG